ncbi:ABC transporter permease [Asaccharospora irregularis]|uniref:Putative ABC transport system permease protein n=1 Tax=Asaccharospora irregularis DSM 2635 TaxID=1121321 RepID=A0A1M5R527_9FIRM|nr:ABC transporter permease [Asaccharospora irregularis]SHH21321.1 putative ABC transport system permease protein [Asaccharospora irregularis DSM 2635]
MENYFKLATLYIKKYINRSIAICASMVLSIALIVGCGTLSQSAKQANIDKTKYEEGLYHVRYKDITKEQLSIIEKNKDIKEIGMTSYYDSNNPDNKLMINLTMANKEYIKSGNSRLIDGTLPTKKNEIALEEWALKNMGLEPKLGEKITLDLYNKASKETYTLVGILKDRAREKSVGQVDGFLAFDINSINKLDAYITFDESSNINENIQTISKQAKIKSDNVRKNNMLLEALGDTGQKDYKVILLAIIVSIVSGIVIHGIFNISILQRASEYGVIRAIGGESLQILMLLFFELLILQIISMPIGVGAGILGAKLFSSIAGGLFTEGTVEITKIIINKDIVIFSGLVTLFIIFIISLFTFKTVKKVSPINAIKKNLSSAKISKVPNNNIKFLTKIMSFEKVISFKNIFSYKKGFFMVILSMGLGGAIFISASFYAHLAKVQDYKKAELSNINTDYKVSIIPTRPMNYGINEESVKKIKELSAVESVNSIQLLYSRLFLDKSEIAEPLYFDQLNSFEYYKNVLNGILTKDENSGKYVLKNIVYGYDDKLLKKLNKYIVDGEIDRSKMRNENIAIIKIPHPIGPNVVDIGVGDIVKVTFREDGNSSLEYLRMEDKGGKYKTEEFLVGGIVDEVIDTADYYSGEDSVDLVISSNRFKKITGFENYQIVNIDKKQGEDHSRLNDNILNITNKTEGSVLYDMAKEREDISLLQKNKIAFIYSIIIVLFVISLFNILNNISYRLISRTNEFGMIRATGMTNNEFKRMIRFEGLIYGMSSSIISVTLGIISQNVLFKVLSPKLISPKFIIQWENYLLIVVINIIIGLIATYFPSKKIKDLSIVESISSLE